MSDLLKAARKAVAAVMEAKSIMLESDTLAAIEELEDACEREETRLAQAAAGSTTKGS